MDLTALGSLALELRLVECVRGGFKLLVLVAGMGVAMAGRGVGSVT